jgi:hypothetical protein
MLIGRGSNKNGHLPELTRTSANFFPVASGKTSGDIFPHMPVAKGGGNPLKEEDLYPGINGKRS